jgi:rRNA processing protein Gar1
MIQRWKKGNINAAFAAQSKKGLGMTHMVITTSTETIGVVGNVIGSMYYLY